MISLSIIISLAFRLLRSPRARMVPPVSITTMSSTSGKYWVEWVTNSLNVHFQLSRDIQSQVDTSHKPGGNLRFRPLISRPNSQKFQYF